jgi:hypothetical protein
MPRRHQGSVPSLQHHKPSNRARVWIKGHTYWLGKWGSPEAQLVREVFRGRQICLQDR